MVYLPKPFANGLNHLKTVCIIWSNRFGNGLTKYEFANGLDHLRTFSFAIGLHQGRLLERRPSKYCGMRLHDCGVELSLHARFRGDQPGNFGVTDVTDTQTDQTFIDIEIGFV